MWLTEIEAIEQVARSASNSAKNLKQANTQRRDVPCDLYGIEYTRQGDSGSPARFYVSISPDMGYLERFEFKLIITPFTSTIADNGVQSATVKVNNTNLSVSGGSVSPNPHNHTTDPHTHSIVSGISQVPVTASDFRVSIDGIDITPYLMAQYDAWIEGEGVYPTTDINKNYDILKVASVIEEEGRSEDAKKLLKAEYKPVEISAGAPFMATLVLYTKYTHLNR